MRTVFDNAMTAHVWANQSQSEGRSNNGNFYFTGRRLYSYGSHFIVGIVLPGIGPILNSDNYSVTTSGHKSDARRAVGYNAPSLPGLTGIADTLESLARAYVSTGETARRYRADAAGARKRLESYIDENAASLDDEAGEMLLKLAGSRGTWANRKARALAKAERERAAKLASAKLAARKLAAEIAAIPLDIVKARAIANGSGGNGYHLDRMAVDYAAAHKNAGGPRIKAAVWQRLKAVRAIRKRLEKVDTYGPRSQAREGVATLRRIALGDWNAGGEKAGSRYPFGRYRAASLLEDATGKALRAPGMPSAIRAKLERQRRIAKAAADRLSAREAARQRKREARERLARYVKGLRHWRDMLDAPDSIHGVTLRQHLTDSPPVARVRTLRAIVADLDGFRDAGRFPAILEALERETRPAVLEALEAAERALEALEAEERANRERIARMSPAERRAAWQAGEAGVRLQYGDTAETGPLLRANGAIVDGCRVSGGELETSEGAKVPLRHAFRVFQFVAACRAAGRGWQPYAVSRKAAGHDMAGPSLIRVGHFQVDRIDADGSFAAGCHFIKWPEIIGLAERLGVADCMADVAEIAPELEAAR